MINTFTRYSFLRQQRKRKASVSTLLLSRIYVSHKLCPKAVKTQNFKFMPKHLQQTLNADTASINLWFESWAIQVQSIIYGIPDCRTPSICQI